MKTWMVASTGLALMAATGVAVAQQAPSPPPPPPAMDGGPQAGGPMGGPMGEHMGGPMGGMHRWRHMGEMMRMHMPPPPSKAAHFRFRRGDAMVDIKCADDEPTKACVDASTALMDKLAATPK